MSLFVNPAQFNEADDLAAYPRDEARDAELAAPRASTSCSPLRREEVYPPGFATTVSVAGLTEPLEGAHRGRGHFDGVATVVTKLLNIVGPDVAYFGQKDAQQALVIRRLVPRPRHAGADRGLPDRARARRARDVKPQRAARQRPSASARRRFTERCARIQRGRSQAGGRDPARRCGSRRCAELT